MAHILAFAGSNSSTSINHQLVKYTVDLIEDHEIQLLNMANYPFPMYAADLERTKGFSNSLVELKNDIQKNDALIISVNEHNGAPSAFFKNVVDWLSRLEREFLHDRKVFLMSTSPGRGGGANALQLVAGILPHFGAEISATFSLPSFSRNFDANKGILDEDLEAAHKKALSKFMKAL